MASPLVTKPDTTAEQFLAGARYRRTVYALKDASPVPDSRLQEILEDVLAFSPSSYNTRPLRMTLVLGDKHKELWDVVAAAAEPVFRAAGDAVWAGMQAKMEGFKNAYGSVVFWTRGKTLEESAAQHPSAAHIFPEFADHSQGMAQIMVWTALALEGLGANLQHFGAIPGVEPALRKLLEVPDDYTLKAHLNFGEEAQPHPSAPAPLPAAETLNVIR